MPRRRPTPTHPEIPLEPGEEVPENGPPLRVRKRLLREAIMRHHGKKKLVAAALAVSHETLRKCFLRWPEMHALVEEARGDAADIALGVAEKHLNSRNPKVALQAAQIVLRQCGYARGYGQRNVVVTGPSGGPVQHAQVTVHLTPQSIGLLDQALEARILAGDQDALGALHALAERGEVRAGRADEDPPPGEGGGPPGEDEGGQPPPAAPAVHPVGQPGSP